MAGVTLVTTGTSVSTSNSTSVGSESLPAASRATRDTVVRPSGKVSASWKLSSPAGRYSTSSTSSTEPASRPPDTVTVEVVTLLTSGAGENPARVGAGGDNESSVSMDS